MAAVIVSPEVEAAAVGKDVLRNGGSAVDAAIAAAFAQAVVNPLLCGLGGSALVLHADLRTGSVTAIDGEAEIGSVPAPSAWSDEFLGRAETFGRYAIRSEDNQLGAGSVMTPGFVDAMELLRSRFGSGRLDVSGLLAGARRLAHDGFVVSDYVAQFWQVGSAGDSHSSRPAYPSLAQKMVRQPETARRYLSPEGRGLRAGERFAQPWIADVLDRLGRAGLDDLLHGQLGALASAALERDASLVTAADLAGYRALPRPAVESRVAGHRVATTPPPSPGVQVVQMLAIAAALGANGREDDADSVDRLAKIMRASFADNRYIKATDPAEAAAVAEAVLRPASVERWARAIDGGDPVAVAGLAPSDGTTHVTVVDEHHAVCITHSLGSVAGSAYLVPELGYLFNNFLGHFDPRPGRPDSVRARARIGTGAPLIAFGADGFRLALGAPGGSRLITSDFQVARSVLLGDDEADTAVERPRIHSEQDRLVFVEPGQEQALRGGLESLGNTVEASTYMSRVQAVSRDAEGRLHAGSDPRGGRGIGVVPDASERG